MMLVLYFARRFSKAIMGFRKKRIPVLSLILNNNFFSVNVVITINIDNLFSTVEKIFGTLNKLNINLKHLISLLVLNSICMEVLIKDDLSQSYYINSDCMFTIIRTHDSLHIFCINSCFE